MEIIIRCGKADAKIKTAPCDGESVFLDALVKDTGPPCQIASEKIGFGHAYSDI